MNLEKTVKKYRELFASKPAVATAHELQGPHFYVSPTTGEKYHSVTYFTSFIKDPSLANWKQNRALEFLRREEILAGLSSNWERDDHEGLDNIFSQAKLAPEGEFKGAGDIGTQTHNWRQKWFTNWINSGQIEPPKEPPYPAGLNPEVISGCRAIKRFLKETGAIPIACELPLVDDELGVGGTIDDLMVFPKIGLVFVDLKTSNQGKKVSYAFQVRGFYQRMIRKTFHRIPRKTYILHTSKDDGTYKLIDMTAMDFLEEDAANLVHLSRSWDKVQEFFKPKIKVI